MSDPRRAPLLVAPDGFVVVRDEQGVEPSEYRAPATRSATLRITWPSRSRGKGVALLLFSVVWFAFLAFSYRTALGPGVPRIMFVFPLIHVGVGCLMLHRALVALLNTTHLVLAGGSLQVKTGPVPPRGDMRVDDTKTLRQLFATRTDQLSRGGTKTTTFAVEAVLDGGRRRVVVPNLESEQAALYLEAILEETLGIEAQPVVGEIAR